MTNRDPEKLRKLLTQNRLKKRAAELATRWSAHGVSASTVAHDRYWKLIDRLKSGRSWPLQYVEDLSAKVRTFISGSDLMTVMGWNVEEEPALLVSSEALLRTMHTIATVYPDGFILINDESRSALMVDIVDDEGIHASVIDLPS